MQIYFQRIDGALYWRGPDGAEARFERDSEDAGDGRWSLRLPDGTVVKGQAVSPRRAAHLIRLHYQRWQAQAGHTSAR